MMALETDSQNPMDTQQTVAMFEDLLQNLNSSKESISKSTKFAVGNLNCAAELLDAILKRMEQSPYKKRLPAFYLIDSICQTAARKQDNEYRQAVIKVLPSIIQAMFNDTQNEEDADQASKVIKKVLAIWQTRGIIGAEVAKEGEMIVNLAMGISEDTVLDFYEFDQMEKEKELAAEKAKQKKEIKTAEMLEDERKMEIIEEWRQESKRIRWESCLRPENDKEFGEFEDLWNRTGIKEVRANIKDYDKKVKELEGCLVGPPFPYEDKYFREALAFMGYSVSKDWSSPVNLVSSPSPSPFMSSPSPATPGTPYSPSLTVSFSIGSKKAVAQNAEKSFSRMVQKETEKIYSPVLTAETPQSTPLSASKSAPSSREPPKSSSSSSKSTPLRSSPARGPPNSSSKSTPSGNTKGSSSYSRGPSNSSSSSRDRETTPIRGGSSKSSRYSSHESSTSEKYSPSKKARHSYGSAPYSSSSGSDSRYYNKRR
eukprot:TRINITY_DN2704_c0_g1_i1.p1 TRINITY_DN2704_c0_g1~~TRINITY_DN2704_c0_g1_i1.p1  ORF type:complete len:484 (-),score=119.39 TRINITY_DN2704_c0_g1_i1:170-1621(-)